jgi:hypothetical protein
MKEKPAQQLSYDTKTIIVVLLLVFVYPVGILLMWIWKLWPLWLRILLTVLLILPILFVLGLLFLLAVFLFSDPQMKSDVHMERNMNVEISQTPESDDKANWKTYINNKYKFTMNYPNMWVYQESDPKDIPSTIWFDYPNRVDKSSGHLLGTIVLDIEDIGSTSIEKWFDGDDYVKTIKDVTIGNFSVKEIRHSACPSSGNCAKVVFKKGNNLYSFYSNIDSQTEKNLKIIYQILSTFKFTQ